MEREHQARLDNGGRGPEPVRIRLLGGFELTVGSRPIAGNELRLKKSRSLVELLALAKGHILHRERVAAVLWPKLDAKRAANNVHRALHFARAAFEPGPRDSPSRYLPLRDGLISLCPDSALWVDAETFEDAAAIARRSGHPASYRTALDLYAGELLPEGRYEVWAEEKREALRRLHHALILELADLHESREEYEQALEILERAAAQEPAEVKTNTTLMRLYALLGRRQEALLQYERLRQALSADGAPEPGVVVRRLHEEIRAGKIPSSPPSPAAYRPGARAAAPGNLPTPLTSFVGREQTLVKLRRALSITRLLTLTGAGGSGKTRLALEVSRGLLAGAAYPDGVWLIELAPLSDWDLVPRAVAAALGVREQPHRPPTQTVCDHLGSKRTLLVLDNCEHLVDATARLASDLLSHCPNLVVLATSREALGIFGETVWPVPTLSLPDPQSEIMVESSMEAEAVRLFVDRAVEHRLDFELTPANARAVASICRRLDGIPLAIELATARMGTLAVDQIADRLENSLGLPTEGSRTAALRQQTLEATLTWSYDLLSEPERTLFGRLSAFAGGWSLEAAEGVCSGGGIEEDRVLDLLGRLVDKSLVVAEASPEGDSLRYRMLEPVRQYGRERLEETERVRVRHAEHYLALAETAEPELLGANQGRWLRRLRTELGNLRAALSWSLGGDSRERAGLGLRLAAALWRFWDVQGFEEGKGWLRAALEEDPGENPAVRAKALGGLGWILLFQQDYGAAIAVLEEAVALYKELGERSGTAIALAHLGYAVLHGGFGERVPVFVEEADALIQGDPDHSHTMLRITRGSAAMEQGDLETAVALLEESLALCRELGDLRNTSMTLFILGTSELLRGDPDRGAAMLQEGARIPRELGDGLGSAYYALALGKLAFLRGRPVRAARLWGAAEALRERIGISLSVFDLVQSGYEQDLATARSSVDENAWAAAWTEGRAMTPDRAIEYGLSADEPAPPAASAPKRSSAERPALTRREEEVAAIVALGLSNRRVAEKLSISRRTVDTHVGRILKKLGLSSREQIAARVEERGSGRAGVG